MPNSIPYICARCLRASKPTPRSSPRLLARVQSQRTRTYYTPSTLLAVDSQQRAIFPSKNSPVYSSYRTISSTTSRFTPPSTTETIKSASPPPPPSPPSSSSISTTRTILNPLTDEETGSPMTIEITPRASNRLSQIMTKDKNPNLCLRVQVESGGCHGFQYLMSLTDLSKIDEAEDTVFIATSNEVQGQEAGEVAEEGEWRTLASGKPKVVMDEPSLELLKGSKIDFTMELIGSQFKIVDNPRASSSCGCGTSFDVKI